MKKKWKAYSEGELKLISDPNLTARSISRMIGRSIVAINMKRHHIAKTKLNKPAITVKTPTVNNSAIKEININGIKILIDGAKLNITI